MKNQLRRAFALALIALTAGTGFAGTSAQVTAPVTDSSRSFEQALPVTSEQKQIDRLLRQLLSNANTVIKHADRLDLFARSATRLHSTTHANELNGARKAINAMAADLRQLDEMRSGALPWQSSVIDRALPLQAALANNATTAIEILNQERERFHHGLPQQEYRDAITNLSDNAGQVRSLVSVNLEYAKAREKLNRLDATGLSTNGKAAITTATVKPAKSLEDRVRSELLKLPYYGVFDHLAFQVDGNQVTLSGDVSQPTLKGDAERATRNLRGVETVVNRINVLPVSPNDDRIRVATYWAVYGHSAMTRYRLDPNPPIRIIVANGHVTLKGVVASEMHRNIAHLQASSVPGAFSVTNELQAGL